MPLKLTFNRIVSNMIIWSETMRNDNSAESKKACSSLGLGIDIQAA